MKNIQTLRSHIYDQFHNSSAGAQYFFLDANRDAYAAYYTSMYLIQDTAEAVYIHMAREFSPDPMLAYIEFWGVMQAVVIQQDAIIELHTAVAGTALTIPRGSAWTELRDKRNLCAGHPANRNARRAPQRTFMGRMFGNYDRVKYEHYDEQTGKTTHPSFDLRQMINDYDVQASGIMRSILSTMRARWP
ncbi:hypothetical protein HFN49_23130 [Rhizobium leguminosarum]|uniref:hypothetical protein n=1 Tax=Rhizobium ruizarguesonis TaxID=2081791 RepID=UPI001A99A144|nr:hypothetical protein [Rhizobium ruizarguesonis]MBY5889083.1 hypothetical protein [Rhizobium leguminosarum]QSZ03084.1 hypothetical protein J3P73_11735 [Rhizobium ruizarguesonis]